jgi:hypothetical protein
MELTEIEDRLLKLDNDKLADVVKNYRQYGYSEEIRNFALAILKRRGITRDDLEWTGNLENKAYNRANDVFTSFKINTIIAFTAYMLAIGIRLGLPLLRMASESRSTVVAVIFTVSLVIYFIFLLRSFLNQSEFYRLTGEEYGSEGALIYLFLGMPFYVIMFFVFRNQMAERLKLVP